ncbi:hypothetical protein BCR43DRAFT_106858 [Syncephalastrum racemosum]|uniref:Uncharacterized protein n=1 Tax=Syncephalastrum racemosum TaxID=13706 RepID=A0A1X2H2Z8_SYNRA|nr:hypothetical protein BCR43DRAFT_106858 [Syncephalastrum racemosum]
MGPASFPCERRARWFTEGAVPYSGTAGRFLTRADERRFNTDPVALKLKGNTDTSLLPGQQALLAGQDGNLYIMQGQQIHRWFQVGFTVHSIVSFRLKSMDRSEPDLFVCIGQASCVHVYQNEKLLLQIDTSDWVKSVTLGDVNGDGEDELVLGLVNKTIEVYKLQCSR